MPTSTHSPDQASSQAVTFHDHPSAWSRFLCSFGLHAWTPMENTPPQLIVEARRFYFKPQPQYKFCRRCSIVKMVHP